MTAYERTSCGCILIMANSQPDQWWKRGAKRGQSSPKFAWNSLLTLLFPFNQSILEIEGETLKNEGGFRAFFSSSTKSNWVRIENMWIQNEVKMPKKRGFFVLNKPLSDGTSCFQSFQLGSISPEALSHSFSSLLPQYEWEMRWSYFAFENWIENHNCSSFALCCAIEKGQCSEELVRRMSKTHTHSDEGQTAETQIKS